MALRLIEMVLPSKDGEELRELLTQYKVIDYWQLPLPDTDVLARILLDAEQSETVLDMLEIRYTGTKGNRAVVVPIEATLPRAVPKPAAEPSEAAAVSERPVTEAPPGRIGREELYEDIKDAARWSRVFLAMVVLSTVVATIGLFYNSVTIIIGAMVIAPLLGPNMALALATALGDLALLRQALLTALAGIATAIAVSLAIGVLLHVDPATSEIASRTRVQLGDVAVAAASGAAGALAFTTGASAAVIGVMVAVALLPPLTVFGLLLGGGHVAAAVGALSLFLINLICVNLAGVTTFLLQGISPATWWEKGRAAKATRIAIALWGTMLATLVGMILLLRKG